MVWTGRAPSALRLKKSETQHMLCIARMHPWQPHDCRSARFFAVKPSPLAHSAAGLTARGRPRNQLSVLRMPTVVPPDHH